MTDDQPAPINRPLDDDERELLNQLTIWSIAEQTGVSDDEAARALDDLNEKTGLYREGDSQNVYVKAAPHGHVIVHCTREWLAYWAHSGEQLTGDELRRVMRKYTKPEDDQ